jgi:hypothetical protein
MMGGGEMMADMIKALEDRDYLSSGMNHTHCRPVSALECGFISRSTARK